ncbi:hypothetical protein [Streptomyces sp. NPDC006739]
MNRIAATTTAAGPTVDWPATTAARVDWPAAGPVDWPTAAAL